MYSKYISIYIHIKTRQVLHVMFVQNHPLKTFNVNVANATTASFSPQVNTNEAKQCQRFQKNIVTK